MKFCYLFLVFAVAAANNEEFNQYIDYELASVNENLRQEGLTSVHIPSGSFGTLVLFNDSEVLGLDSLKRTDNCTVELSGTNMTLDLHFGLSFYQQSFKFLKLSGHDMSASYRVRDNSVRLHFTLSAVPHCFVILHDLYYERLANIEFSSSRPEYDGNDFNEFFEKGIVPYLNKKIDKPAIEKGIEKFFCNQSQLDIFELTPLIHQSILEQIAFLSKA